MCTFNAAMRGRLRGVKAEIAAALKVARIGAYHAGNLANVDWSKMPPLNKWLDQFEPHVPLTNEQIAARFSAWAEASKPQPEEQD